MLGQLQDVGNTVTLAYYLELLDAAGLLAGIEKYSGSKIRQRSSSPKFQVYNTALISAQQVDKITQILSKPEIWGHLVESSAGAHLLNHSRENNYNLFYWRHGNNEIDFVMEKSGKIIGLEVKSGVTQKASGMNAFKKEFNPHKTFLIGNSGILWQDFLKMDPNDLF